METTIQDAFLDLVESEWNQIACESRPESIWVREYPPLPTDAMMIPVIPELAIPVAVWFIDHKGRRPESISKWLRITAVKRFEIEELHILSPFPLTVGGNTFTMGVAAFATYLGTDRFYIETQWGPRWGLGSIAHITPDGAANRIQDVWRS